MSGVTLAKTYDPVSLVTPGADFVFRDSLISTTVAPGITPPWLSTTVPVIVPVVICAATGVRPAHAAIIAKARTRTFLNSMLPPPIASIWLPIASETNQPAGDSPPPGRTSEVFHGGPSTPRCSRIGAGRERTTDHRPAARRWRSWVQLLTRKIFELELAARPKRSEA